MSTEHRSISQINKYAICPRQYRYHYIDGIRSTGSIHTAIGSAFDKCINQVIDGFDHEAFAANTGDRADMEQALDQLIHDSVSTMLSSADEVLKDIPCDEEGRGTVNNTLFHLSHLVSPYFKRSLPMRNLIPVSAQHQINYLINGLDHPVKGYVDMIAKSSYNNRIVIVDQKTGKGAKKEVSLDHSRQVWVYSKAIQEEFGLDYLPASEVHYFHKTPPSLPREKKQDNHINGVVINHAQLRSLPLSEWPDEVLAALYSNEEKMAKMSLLHSRYDHSEYLALEESFFDLEFSYAHDFWPKNRTHRLCSEEWCSHWDTCVGSEVESSLSEKRNRHALHKRVKSPDKMVVDIKPPPHLIKSPPAVDRKADFNNFLIS